MFALLSRLFRPKNAKPQAKPQTPRKATLSVERLENRELLATSVFLEGTTLKILGDSFANNITVRHSGSSVTVEGSATRSYNTDITPISKVHFEGNGSNDFFSLYTSSLPSYADGGSGNDTLDGGGGPDTFIGGSGNDKLLGRGGNDWLLGGANDDTLEGGSGNDTLTDGIGKNRLFGNSGQDTLNIVPGFDKGSGSTGADTLKVTFNAGSLLDGSYASIFFNDTWTSSVAGSERDTLILKLDLASFGDRFLEPIVKRLQRLRDAVEPVFDFLNKKLVPGYSSITVASVIRTFGGGSQLTKFLNAYKTIDSLTSNINYSSTVEVGRFKLGATSSGVPSIERLTSANVESLIPGTTVKKLRDSVGIRFNVLSNVTNLLKVAMGQKVTIFTYNLPKLSFNTGDKTITQFHVNVVGPLGVTIKLLGGVKITAGGTASLDSTGFFKTGKILDGFNVSNLFISINPYIIGRGSPGVGGGGWSISGGVNIDAKLSGTLKLSIPSLSDFRVSTSGKLTFGITGSIQYYDPFTFNVIRDILGFITGRKPKLQSKGFNILAPRTIASF